MNNFIHTQFLYFKESIIQSLSITITANAIHTFIEVYGSLVIRSKCFDPLIEKHLYVSGTADIARGKIPFRIEAERGNVCNREFPLRMLRFPFAA